MYYAVVWQHTLSSP